LQLVQPGAVLAAASNTKALCCRIDSSTMSIGVCAAQSDVQRAVDLAGPQGPYCFGDQIHFQIIGGRLYVRFQTGNLRMPGVHTRDSDGWFPGNEGPGERLP